MDWIYHLQRHAALTSSECRAILVISFIIFLGSSADLFLSKQQFDPALRAQFDDETQINFAALAEADTIKSSSAPGDSIHVHRPDSLNELSQTILKKKRRSHSKKIVNINTATKSQLISLKGIGPSLAKRIIDYRKSHGPFGGIAEIQNVKGIGKGKFKSIKDRIRVE